MIELSVIEGTFDEKEIILIVESLKVVDELAIHTIGEQSFTTCSYTARLNKSKWGDDEISRVTWYEPSEKIWIEESLGMKLPKNHHEFFFWKVRFC